MPEEINPEGLSIADGFAKGLAEIPNAGDGSQPAADGSQDGTVTPPDGGKGGAEPDEIDDDGNPVVKTPPKEPIVNPEEGKYEGEYKKERFDGLMSQWQKDRAKTRELEAKLAEMGKVSTPAEKAPQIAPQDPELPPELADADPETQRGYQIVMKGVQSTLSKVEEKIIGKLLDILNAPIKKENEAKTRVDSEVEELKIAEGTLFANNQKEILTFASENDYPLGTLKLAYKAWKKEQELTGRIKELTGAKKTVAEIEEENRKNASIPRGGKGAGSQIPKFDPDKDGDMSIGDAFDKIKGLL